MENACIACNGTGDWFFDKGQSWEPCPRCKHRKLKKEDNLMKSPTVNTVVTTTKRHTLELTPADLAFYFNVPASADMFVLGGYSGEVHLDSNTPVCITWVTTSIEDTLLNN